MGSKKSFLPSSTRKLASILFELYANWNLFLSVIIIEKALSQIKKKERTKLIVMNIFRIVFILFLFILVNLYSASISSSLFTKDCRENKKSYYVKSVFDGDTVLVGSGQKSELREKIRFVGIDAFEHEQNGYGKSGKDFLSMLVLNKNICVETDVQKKDIYGRTLGYVFVMDRFINEELVKNGLALLYDFPPNIKYIDKLKKAQIYARQNMLGVWENQEFIKETPAQWRRKHPFKKHKKN